LEYYIVRGVRPEWQFKITRGLANIAQGLEDCLYLGNLDSKRDWGHAKDYVEMQWLMLQQEKPEDFVIASGRQYKVREFVEAAAKELCVRIRWEGSGMDEVGYVDTIEGDHTPALEIGQRVIAVDPRYFRPAEVETLLGDPTHAREKLGWETRISFEDMVAEMVRTDLHAAEKHVLLRKNGFDVPMCHE